MAGTAEVVVLELAKVLKPVSDRLAAPGGLEALFADLGLPLPQPVRDAADVVAATGAAAAAVGEVIPLIGPLAAAVAARDEGAAAAALTALLPKATDAFTKTKDVAIRVQAAYDALGPAVPELEEVLAQLPERLVDLLVVSYLEGYRPVGARTLALLGVVESTPVPATGQRPAHVRRTCGATCGSTGSPTCWTTPRPWSRTCTGGVPRTWTTPSCSSACARC